jgi:hypothetical protein
MRIRYGLNNLLNGINRFGKILEKQRRIWINRKRKKLNRLINEEITIFIRKNKLIIKWLREKKN